MNEQENKNENQPQQPPQHQAYQQPQQQQAYQQPQQQQAYQQPQQQQAYQQPPYQQGPYQQPPYQQGPYQQGPYQQPVYQQTVVVQQTAPTVTVASQGEKDAFFSTTGSVWMLVASIVFTINLITSIVNNLLSGIINSILLLLIAIGFWVTFANGRSKNLSKTGIQLIRVPYIILFVFECMGFAGNLILWIFTFNILSFFFGILSFIFSCICFASIMKTLNMGVRIGENKSVMGMKAGVFAGVIMIISASFIFIKDLVNFIIRQTLVEILLEIVGDTAFGEFLIGLIGGNGVFAIVAMVVALLASIAAAIVLLKFHKKIKEVNG